jgi:hypothetical protein
MRAYAERVRASGPPWSDDEELAAWQNGTAVNLLSEG